MSEHAANGSTEPTDPSTPEPDFLAGPRMSRQELYHHIREAGGREAFTLREMLRLGFIKPGDEMSQEAIDLLDERNRLQKELNALYRQDKLFEDPAALLRSIRAERMAEARARREETKQRREAERQTRAEAWRQTKLSDITWLGHGVSGGLSQTDGQHGSIADLAHRLESTVSELRFLAFQRRVSATSHYKRFHIPKKSGGVRCISAPMPRLKHCQHKILETLLAPLPLHEAAHGFVPSRSILSNALPHVGADILINLDLKDFFPTVTYPRVKGLFKHLGYSEQQAIVLGLICTEAETDEVEIDGRRWFVQNGARHLPQGAPTSPAITNLLCRKLDARMAGIARQLGFTYTRYADDLSFSQITQGAPPVRQLLWRVRAVIHEEGFTIHPDKLRIMRNGARKEVTGIVVNEKPAIPRDTLRRFRAVLHQVDTQGPEGKHWNGNTNVIAALRGFACFLYMVDPAKGAPALQRIQAIAEREGWKQEIKHPKKAPRPIPVDPSKTIETDQGQPTAPTVPTEQRDKAARDAKVKLGNPTQGTAKKKPWWKRIIGG